MDDDGEPSKFTNLGFALWFTFVTLTTTGYGDLVPKTWLGRVLAVPIMWVGVVLLALPSIVVGRQFIQIMDYWKAQREHHEPQTRRNGKKQSRKGQGSGGSPNQKPKRQNQGAVYLNTQAPWRKSDEAESTAVDLGGVNLNRKPINIPESAVAPPTPRQRGVIGAGFPGISGSSLPQFSLDGVPMPDTKRMGGDAAAATTSASLRDPAAQFGAGLAATGGSSTVWDEQRFDFSRICVLTAEIIATRSTRELVDHIRILRTSMRTHQNALNFAYHALEDLVEGLCDEYGSGEEVMSIN